MDCKTILNLVELTGTSNMHDEITIIIPTHNRHSFLKRVLSYYSNVAINIIVVDSSKTIFTQANKFNCKYFHFPDGSYYKKLNYAISEVNTPYVLLCADDDFIVPSAIRECVLFLSNNPDYSSAQGNYVDFYRGLRVRCKPFPLLHIIGLDVNADNSSKRIEQLFHRYMFLHYSVHRTQNLVDTFFLSQQLSPVTHGVAQYFLDIVCIINGKHKVLPVFYGAREVMLDSATHTVMAVGHLRREPKYKMEYDALVNILSTHLANKEKLDMHKSRELISEVFEKYSYFNPAQHHVSPMLYRPISNSVIKRVINSLPNIDKIKKRYSDSVYKMLKYKGYLKKKYNSSDIEKVKAHGGFPFNDEAAKNEWIKIKDVIKAHKIK